MKSRMKKYAELFLIIVGGFYMCYHGVMQIVHLQTSDSSSTWSTAYAAGEFIGSILSAAFPLVIGLGLLVIVYSRIFKISNQG